METHVTKRYRYALGLITLIICLIPVFALSEIFRESENYRLSDFKEYGMIFTKPYQAVVENLTKQLLERERSGGHFAGERQRDVIREKCKKYVAINRGVYPGKPGEADGSSHKAVRATNQYFMNWCEGMDKTPNEAEKRQAKQEYDHACELAKQIQEGKDAIQQEKLEKSRAENMRRGLEKEEWERQTYEQYDRENAERAAEEKERECARRCRAQYWDSDILYYDCFNMCKGHETPSRCLLIGRGVRGIREVIGKPEFGIKLDDLDGWLRRALLV